MPKPKPPLKKISGKFSGPSVKDALKGKLQGEEEISAKEQHALYNNTSETEGFTQEQLAEKWKNFLETISDKPSLKATLADVPKLSEDYKLEITIENSVQEEALKGVKPELVSWLRRELKNSKIELITKKQIKKTGRIVYTDTEKFQEMLKKNPDLDLLKQRFKLDFGE